MQPTCLAIVGTWTQTYRRYWKCQTCLAPRSQAASHCLQMGSWPAQVGQVLACRHGTSCFDFVAMPECRPCIAVAMT